MTEQSRPESQPPAGQCCQMQSALSRAPALMLAVAAVGFAGFQSYTHSEQLMAALTGNAPAQKSCALSSGSKPACCQNLQMMSAFAAADDDCCTAMAQAAAEQAAPPVSALAPANASTENLSESPATDIDHISL